MKLRFKALALPLVLCCSVVFAAQSHLTMHQALDVAEKAGYKNIHAVKKSHSSYIVRAKDAKGEKTQLKIDAITGKLTKLDSDKQAKHGKTCKSCCHSGSKHHGKHTQVKPQADTNHASSNDAKASDEPKAVLKDDKKIAN